MKKLIFVLTVALFLSLTSTTFGQDRNPGQPVDGGQVKSLTSAPSQNQNRSGFRDLADGQGKPYKYGISVGTESWNVALLNASHEQNLKDEFYPSTQGNRFTVSPVLRDGEKLTEATIGFSANYGALTNATTIRVLDETGGQILAEVSLGTAGVRLGYMGEEDPVFYGWSNVALNPWRGITLQWMYNDGNYSYGYILRVKLKNPGNVIVEVTRQDDRGTVQVAAGGFSSLTPNPHTNR